MTPPSHRFPSTHTVAELNLFPSASDRPQTERTAGGAVAQSSRRSFIVLVRAAVLMALSGPSAAVSSPAGRSVFQSVSASSSFGVDNVSIKQLSGLASTPRRLAVLVSSAPNCSSSAARARVTTRKREPTGMIAVRNAISYRLCRLRQRRGRAAAPTSAPARPFCR